MTSEHAAFWSYAHDDDSQDRGRIRALAEDLSSEFSLITGAELAIFFDRRDIRWGDEWRERIESSLAHSTFFIPIITPRYFKRPECRRELLEFHGQLEAQGLGRMIMPIQYVTVSALTSENPDEAVALSARLQYEDWTELRLCAKESHDYRQAVNRLARRLADLAAEAANAQLDFERNSAESSDAQPGVLDLRDEIMKILPFWIECIHADQLHYAQHTALSQVFRDRREKLQRANAPKSQQLAVIQAEARNELPMEEARLGLARDLVRRTVELNPMILRFLRELEDSGADLNLADELRIAVADALEGIHSAQAVLEQPGHMLSIDYWRSYSHLGKTMRTLVQLDREINECLDEANALIEEWGQLLEALHAGPDATVSLDLK